MLARLQNSLVLSLLIVAVASSTSSGASISAGPQPAPHARASDHPRGQTRRPAAVELYCPTNGFLSFVGGGQNNIAGGLEAGIAAGSMNQACGAYDAIVGGAQNAIYPNGGADNRSFIGAGLKNQIYSNGLGGTYGAFIGAGSSNSVTAWYAAIVAGNANVIAAAGAASFIGGGTTNSANGETSFIGAGQQNETLGTDAFIGAGTSNTANTMAFVGAGSHNVASGQDSFIGAGKQNVTSGAGAFVGAGGTAGSAGQINTASGIDSFIGAGDGNSASAPESFIGAGLSNVIATTKAGGASGAAHAVIGGGSGNLVNPIVKDGAQNAVIAGGASNLVTGVDATIGGGYKNVASGEYATVPGGEENVAAGIGSFAVGTKAGALHNGTFVWSDGSSTSALTSSAPYQFIARAKGGFFLYSNSKATAGVELTPGSGTWASLSDRKMKRGIAPADDTAVLRRLGALPIDEWSYVSERGVRHLGPMAQDFYAAFHVGADDRHITSIDESGVALAAIKALSAEKASLQSTYVTLQRDRAALHTEVTAQRTDNARLRARLDALEAQVAALAQR